jgi:hypothetical protein
MVVFTGRRSIGGLNPERGVLVEGVAHSERAARDHQPRTRSSPRQPATGAPQAPVRMARIRLGLVGDEHEHLVADPQHRVAGHDAAAMP